MFYCLIQLFLNSLFNLNNNCLRYLALLNNNVNLNSRILSNFNFYIHKK